MVGDPAHGNAGGSAASDVLLKITQCELMPLENPAEGYRISPIDERANYCLFHLRAIFIQGLFPKRL